MESVFVVDDEPTIQFFFKQLLTLNGFKLAGIAKNGQDAVSLFKSFLDKPKVILMDHRMPIKNGIDASKEILQIDNKVKIIFITGDNSVKEDALSAGVFSFQDKPFSIRHIINEINKAINSY